MILGIPQWAVPCRMEIGLFIWPKLFFTTFCLGYLVIEHWNNKKKRNVSPLDPEHQRIGIFRQKPCGIDVKRKRWRKKHSQLIFFLFLFIFSPPNYRTLTVLAKLRCLNWVTTWPIAFSFLGAFWGIEYLLMLFLARYLWDSILAFLSKHLEPKQ